MLHGADSDVVWLQRDFGIFIANLFDTGQASRVLALPSHGLAHLLAHFCDVKARAPVPLPRGWLCPVLTAACCCHRRSVLVSRCRGIQLGHCSGKFYTVNAIPRPAKSNSRLVKRPQLLKGHVEHEVAGSDANRWLSRQLLALLQ